MLFIKKVTFSRLDFIESFFFLSVCIIIIFTNFANETEIILYTILRNFFYFNIKVHVLLYGREISAKYLLKRYPKKFDKFK